MKKKSRSGKFRCGFLYGENWNVTAKSAGILQKCRQIQKSDGRKCRHSQNIENHDGKKCRQIPKVAANNAVIY